MTRITFQGKPVETTGHLPATGSSAPDFILTRTDLTDITLADLAGKRAILNIFPSIDTPVCAMSVRRFNAEASRLENTKVLCVSRDLPFAHARFCGAEGLEDVISASELRNDNFGTAYGVRITTSPLAGLFSRAIVIIDATGRVLYTQQVGEIGEEPDYEAALKTLS